MRLRKQIKVSANEDYKWLNSKQICNIFIVETSPYAKLFQIRNQQYYWASDVVKGLVGADIAGRKTLASGVWHRWA